MREPIKAHNIIVDCYIENCGGTFHAFGGSTKIYVWHHYTSLLDYVLVMWEAFSAER